MNAKKSLPVKSSTGPKDAGKWVQTERAAHESWAALIAKAPKAAQVMHVLTARVGDQNAVVISHKTLAALIGAKSVTTVKAALAVLEAGKLIEIRQIGQNGTVNAYVLNDRIVWSGPRDGIRYGLFSATVIVADNEQPDRDHLNNQEPLRRLPSMLPGEQQLPAGEGSPPPSQPALPGMDPDLPALKK
jgi:hypothetical protein